MSQQKVASNKSQNHLQETNLNTNIQQIMPQNINENNILSNQCQSERDQQENSQVLSSFEKFPQLQQTDDPDNKFKDEIKDQHQKENQSKQYIHLVSIEKRIENNNQSDDQINTKKESNKEQNDHSLQLNKNSLQLPLENSENLKQNKLVAINTPKSLMSRFWS